MDGPETLYIEPTNRCNLACTTCPRTFFPQEAPRDLSLDEFQAILDQVPTARRLVLHGVGEPLLHPNLPELVQEARDRGLDVLFNTNAQLLTLSLGKALSRAGLGELRVSLDAPVDEAYGRVRKGGSLAAVTENLRRFRSWQIDNGVELPKLSLGMTEGRDRLPFLTKLVELGAELGIPEVYLQRLVVLGTGDATRGEATYNRLSEAEEALLEGAEVRAHELGVLLRGSGNRSGDHLHQRNGNRRPWTECRRPYMATYITVHGNVLPCCIAPFSAPLALEECTFANIFESPFDAIWDGPLYREFREKFASDNPPVCCRDCGTWWSL